jgi:transcriptional regulator with GAF, ATPase, and Fis domain
VNSEVSTLKQRIEELEEIHRLAQSLSSMVNVYQTLEAIVDCCMKLCRAERGAILLFSTSVDESARTVVRNAQHQNRGIDHLVNSLVAGWIGVHKRPLLTDDVIRELNLRNPGEQLRQLGPAMAVPLMEAGKPFGMVHLANTRGGDQFTEEHVRTVSAVAPLATQFILRAKVQEAVFADNQRLKASLQKERGVGSLIGVSQLIAEVRNRISIAGPSNANVLLIGETGTGKEVAAKAIHAHSTRADKPFIAVNCAAIPATLFESELFGHEKGSFTGATTTMKGKFEQADGGTLFLDEISAMPVELQPKLLRVLEERSFCRIGSSEDHHVSVRVIAATNKNLQELVHKNEFREDLYHRLNVVPVQLPTLRERREDIPVLATAFLTELTGGTKTFDDASLEILSGFEWKGNVRELRNVVERISIFAEAPNVSPAALQLSGIVTSLAPSPDAKSFFLNLLRSNGSKSNLLETVERDLINLALQESHGNAAEAARILGVHRNAFLRRLEKHNIR